MTFSIVARDPGTGQLGSAVHTRWFNVGAVVPWVQAGVGAAATQSFARVAHGPGALELMKDGASAEEALSRRLENDDGRDLRQVAVVDAEGRTAAHTGSKCVAEAGDIQGDGVSCQANMMERDTVWGAMLEAYESADGDLADRLFAALRAAEGEGGDMRGRQSAALLVVPGNPGEPWERLVDLRVDDHPDPVGELGRLLGLHRAFEHANRAGELGTESTDLPRIAAEWKEALALAPEDDQLAFWTAAASLGSGDVEEARRLAEQARTANPRWPAYLRRVAEAGIFPNDPALLDAFMPLDDPPG